MRTGRPTKLNDALIEDACNYIDDFQGAIPSVAGLALQLKVARSTIYKWAEENRYFSDILGDILAKQELMCLSGGLTGDFNATIAKLVLGKHGYSDKQETELSGNPDKPLSSPVTFVDAGTD